MSKFIFLIPLAIGLTIGTVLYTSIGWWGFLPLFPWIGLSISIGVFLSMRFTGQRKIIGRRVSILMILPSLLIFVPVVNNENFQLGGVVLIVSVGFFSKGFIHYAIAKIFGPLIWRRGFCGWACWTAAVLEWLPLKDINRSKHFKLSFIRYIAFALSVGIPLYMVFILSYDPYTQFINNTEMKWMFISNGIYYAAAIPMAYILKDRRAFCKYACPVALIMKIPSSIGLLKKKPVTGVECIECGKCNSQCPMGIDVMSYMKVNKPVTSTECILCDDCSAVCPVGKIGG